jgi:formate dehydrogenase major subunit
MTVCLQVTANRASGSAYNLGIEVPDFIMGEVPRDNSAAFIMRDPNKCILCGRCIDGCNELVVNQVLAFANRGWNKIVVCDTDLPMGASTCVQCGECVQLCPVGALIDKKRIGKARTWETRKVGPPVRTAELAASSTSTSREIRSSA